ncbi:hypothetical protein [Compostibacter hankyongensis]|uniref:DUF4386 family protein n=1 Tax=Compostibacter hankyongensis TaxID=1007089 RepID=A0ABP8FKY1_9BACT
MQEETVPEGKLRQEAFRFPGRWVGGTSMILAPLLLLAGILLRMHYPFFYTYQLTAFREQPALITTSYSLFALGNVLLGPAIITLAQRIGTRRPVWAVWGATLTLLGLFARTFHAGVDHLAFQLTRSESLEEATRQIGDAYGAFHVFHAFNLFILCGWIVLAAGAYLSRTLGLIGAIALALMSVLMIGVLKGTGITSIIAAAGLCIALLPLGIKVLCEGPRPSFRSLTGWLLLLAALGYLCYFLGEKG